MLHHHIPDEICVSKNKSELKVELKCGSIYQIVGADSFDSLVGPNPVGIILDEWGVSDTYPKAWNYFRPMLAENEGWAVFVYTPRGRNHGWDQYQMAMNNPLWFSQLLTVDHTNAVTAAAIQKERDDGMPESMIQQEFYCSFLASTENIVIPFEFIQRALDRDTDYPHSGRIAGYDPARYGDDRNGFVIRQAGQINHVEFWGGQDSVYCAGKIIDAYKIGLFDCVAVDTIGIGGPVHDFIKNAKVPCVSVDVTKATTDDSRFKKLRDELWWKLREWFEDGACSISKGIPVKERRALVSDIQDIKYSYTGIGRIEIETKKDMKERLGFSPDLGDGACLTFSPEIEMKVRSINRNLPFGRVKSQLVQASEEDYDPLNFGLGVG